jgi:GTP cyclohydrolase II
MEGSQRGCTLSCEGMHDFLVEQVIVHTSCRTDPTLTDPRIEMGKYLHGFHHKIAKGAGQGLYLRGSGQVEKICASQVADLSSGRRSIL